MSKIATFLFVNSIILASLAGVFLVIPQNAGAANCTPRATKQCVSNIVYWYNSCGALEEIAQNCNTTGQVCQNAQCTAPATTNPPANSPTPTTQTGTNHYTKSCYQGNLYWYSSQGTLQEMVQNCADANSCTTDNCASSACVNQLKCDGSTCAVGSPDYTTYCQGGQTTTNTTTTGTNTNPPAGGPTSNTQSQGLAVSLFIAQDTTSPVWQKTLNITANEKLVFMEIIKNTSTAPIENVSVTTDITGNLAYTGNLQIDGIPSAGSITSGLLLGTIPAKTSKMISFTATVAAQTTQTTFQVGSTINTNSTLIDSDYVVLNTASPATLASSSSDTTAENTLWGNLKRNWWIWLIILIVLVVVFIIIFRKLSTNV